MDDILSSGAAQEALLRLIGLTPGAKPIGVVALIEKVLSRPTRMRWTFLRHSSDIVAALCYVVNRPIDARVRLLILGCACCDLDG